MKIALISYEFAGSPSAGGIGTYVRNAAQMLTQRGHSVEVFTGDKDGSSSRPVGDLVVHTVVGKRKDFPLDVLRLFSRRHAANPFDVIEGPEFGADAAALACAFPELPLVVKHRVA